MISSDQVLPDLEHATEQRLGGVRLPQFDVNGTEVFQRL